MASIRHSAPTLLISILSRLDQYSIRFDNPALVDECIQRGYQSSIRMLCEKGLFTSLQEGQLEGKEQRQCWQLAKRCEEDIRIRKLMLGR
ncbi:hypothetical protein [Pokkaliibacter sp. CJK22405]|uniref:hypothetical protein n=1 Tax=Pokkaliibacter sp. CJK22405 TaxID=3384615 RepID=UPI00398481F5